MKILHFADVHARGEDLAEIIRCTEHMIGVAREEAVDLIVDAGDVFHSQHIRADSPAVKHVHSLFKRLADIAPVVRIIGTRSHDGHISETLDLIRSEYEIRTASIPTQLICSEAGGLYTASEHEAVSSGLYRQVTVSAVITLVPAPTKEHLVGLAPEADINETDQMIAQGLTTMFLGFAASAQRYNAPHILVGHWNTTGAYISPTQILTGRDIEVSRDQMMAASPTLVCLGHIHKAQQIGSDPIFYSGSTQVNTWGELDRKGFYIHDIDGLDVVSRFIQTPTRRRLVVSNDFTRNPGDPIEMITRAASDACTPGTIGDICDGAMVRVAIKFFQDEEAMFDDEGIARIFPGAYSVDVVRNRIARANVRAARMLEIERLAEKVAQRAELMGEELPSGVLAKADMLEDVDPETLLLDVESEYFTEYQAKGGAA